MGDLISREALLDTIRNKGYSDNPDTMFEELMEDIESQPTAYNVENVVEELEKESVETDGFLMIHTEGAVDIVKMGGINN